MSRKLGAKVSQKDEIIQLKSRIKELEQILAQYQRDQKPLPVKKNEIQQLFAEIFDVTSLTDLKLQTIWSSSTWQKLFGGDIEKLWDTFRLVHPDDRPDVERAWTALVEKDSPLRDVVCRYRLAEGKYRYFEVSAFPVTVEDQYLFYVVVRDINDRKQAEEELKKHRDHLEDLVRERTEELEKTNFKLKEKNAELERFHDATVDREFRMQELREKIEELEKELGRAHKRA